MRTYSLDILDAALQRIGPHIGVIKKCFTHTATSEHPDSFEWAMLWWFVAITIVLTVLGIALAPLVH